MQDARNRSVREEEREGWLVGWLVGWLLLFLKIVVFELL
jgi:hypothetical protein